MAGLSDLTLTSLHLVSGSTSFTPFQFFPRSSVLTEFYWLCTELQEFDLIPLRFTAFHLVSLASYRVYSFIVVCTVLQGFHLVPLSFTAFHLVLLGSYRVLLGMYRVARILLGSNQFYSVSLSFTGILPSFTEFEPSCKDLTWFHSVLQGFP